MRSIAATDGLPDIFLSLTPAMCLPPALSALTYFWNNTALLLSTTFEIWRSPNFTPPRTDAALRAPTGFAGRSRTWRDRVSFFSATFVRFFAISRSPPWSSGVDLLSPSLRSNRHLRSGPAALQREASHSRPRQGCGARGPLGEPHHASLSSGVSEYALSSSHPTITTTSTPDWCSRIVRPESSPYLGAWDATLVHRCRRGQAAAGRAPGRRAR